MLLWLSCLPLSMPTTCTSFDDKGSSNRNCDSQLLNVCKRRHAHTAWWWRYVWFFMQTKFTWSLCGRQRQEQTIYWATHKERPHGGGGGGSSITQQKRNKEDQGMKAGEGCSARNVGTQDQRELGMEQERLFFSIIVRKVRLPFSNWDCGGRLQSRRCEASVTFLLITQRPRICRTLTCRWASCTLLKSPLQSVYHTQEACLCKKAQN